MSTDNQTKNATPAANQSARKKRRAPKEIHHHHHHYGKQREQREVSMDGVPYDVIKGRIDARRRRNGLLVLSLVPVFAVIAWLYSSSIFATPIAMLIPVVLAGVVYFMDDFKEEEYYEIQGSRFKDGGHRCIHCGHDRIWRHSPYQTNHTLADCANKACGANFWKEPKE